MLGRELGMAPQQTANMVLEKTMQRIAAEIEAMFSSWEQEPAYRIWELEQRKNTSSESCGDRSGIIWLAASVREEMGCSTLTPADADVANAIGAVLAKINLRLTFHFDTDRNFYFIEENGAGKLKGVTSLADAENLH